MNKGWLGHFQSLSTVSHQAEVRILIDGTGDARVDGQLLPAREVLRRYDSQARYLINHFLVLTKDVRKC